MFSRTKLVVESLFQNSFMDTSVSAFLADDDDDAYFSEDIQFSDEDIPEAFHQMLPKANHNLGININRKRFLQMAPSLMQLIHHGKGGKSLHQPTTIDFHGAAHGDYQGTPPPSSPLSGDDAEAPIDGHNESHLSSPESPQRNQARRGGSVVDELLAAKVSEFTDSLASSKVDIQELATKAALEFEQLAQSNDILYRESESLMIRHKALQRDHDRLERELRGERTKSDEYKQQIEALQRENESMRGQMKGISTRLSNDSLSHSEINTDGIAGDDDKAVIDQLQSELIQLKRRVSHQEEDEQQAVQRLMDLTEIGQSNNEMLMQQLEEDEYEEIVEVVEVEVTDDEGDDGVDHEQMAQELESKQRIIESLNMEKAEFERTVSGLAHQVTFAMI